MRQWMVNPKIMCRKHLLGEHVEHHMFLGTMLKGKSIGGYIDNDLLEPTALWKRHEELVGEMKSRGYNHNSPFQLELPEIMWLHDKYAHVWQHRIDRDASYKELVSRCPECKARSLDYVQSIRNL